MAHLDPTSGLMVDDDEEGGDQNGGSLGEQAGAPSFMPPPPVPASNPLTQPIADNLSGNDLSFVPPAGGGMDVRRPVLSDADKANLGAIVDTNTALDANADEARGTAEDAGKAKVDRAVDAAAQAQAEADLKDELAQKAEQERQRHEERITRLRVEHELAYEKHKAMGLKDPDAGQSFGHKLAAALAIGLGQYSAAINHTSNAAAKIFEDARAENLALQRANIEKAKDDAIAAGANVKEALADRDRSLALLHAQDIGKIDAFRSKFAAESARLGIPEARIAASKTMQDLDRQALEARNKRFDALERHLEATRVIERDATPRELRGGKGGGGAGGGKGAGNAEAKVYDYLNEHPGDNAGASRLAASLKIDPKRVDRIIGASKPSEGQTKGAEFAAAGLRAVDSLQKGKYVPNEKDAQKWLDNQREVYRAEKMAEGGALGAVGASLAQKTGFYAKSEVDGLSPEAQEYFANVRRLMEPLGRAKSGAAISQSEWTNFFNQYGPRSKGGFEAARKDLNDMFKLSGVAGRQLDAGKPKAEAATPEAKPQRSEQEQAKAIFNSPGYKNFSPEKKAFVLQKMRGQ